MIPFALHTAATDFGHAQAIIDEHGSLSYAHLLQQAQRVARNLQACGVQPGDRVALLLPVEREYPILLWALFGLSTVAVPLNNRLPVKGLAQQLERAGCRYLISSSDFAHVPQDVQHISAGSCFADLKKDSRWSFPAQVDEQQPATLVFTSGSTGRPAAALHSYGNHYFNALGSNTNITLAPGDRWLLSLPLYHVSGMSLMFRTALGGAALVLPRKDGSLAENMARFAPTHISLVAAQLQSLLNDESAVRVMQSMKAILLGGSAIPADLLRQARRLNLPLHVSYGSTEMASQICTTRAGAEWEELRTGGNVLPYREVNIAADGEVLVRGQTLFLGYWQNGALQRPLNKEGWFASGDVGFFDEKNRLVISGRKDRLFISGGENIQPEEIERQLEQLPQVRRAVVVSVADQRFGRRPVAFVQQTEQGAPEEEKLRTALADRLPAYKIPIRFLPWPEGAAAGMKIKLKEFEKLAETIIH